MGQSAACGFKNTVRSYTFSYSSRWDKSNELSFNNFLFSLSFLINMVKAFKLLALNPLGAKE